jgi:hypothetical protein
MADERKDAEFLTLGIQYYIAARSAVMAQLLPVCGTLFHHSVQMLLKLAYQRKMSRRDLGKRYGHRLPGFVG